MPVTNNNVDIDYRPDFGENPQAFSLDPYAGGSYAGKPIWNLGQITANLNRTGYDWYTDNYGELNDGVLDFGFWKNYEELANSYYVNETGTIAFNEAYYADDFSPFTAGQMAVARTTIGLWNDLISISFRETRSGAADITYGNTYTGGAQAYAYLPFGSGDDQFYADNYGFEEAGRLGGDVWIDGFVPSNFNPLKDSYYSVLTMIHETGHALGLSHPGDYDALDDNDGDGVPDPITYENDAAFAQDSLQYSVMSYFDAYETGAQHIDFSLLNFAYAATPLIHDIAAIQAIYGADTTTRTGNTVYGFNSTADRAAYDFTQNTRPIVAIWDAGGNDTLDFSGWNTPSVIDLNEGAFSSGGGIASFLTLDQINANRAALGFAPRTAAQYAFYEDLKASYDIESPLFKDNISIAYGAVIENAIGGGGNDRIVSNTVANTLTGNGGSDIFEFNVASAKSGIDKVTDFGRSDVLAVDKQIYDSNNDGIITFKSDRIVTLDSTDGDKVQLVGVNNNNGLRLLGSADGEFYYADTRARPIASSNQRVLEGTVGNNTLQHGGGAATQNVFFFDTALAVATGSDTIQGFTARDVIVTTSKIADSNNDNIIGFGSDGLLDLANGGVVGINGGAVTSLEFDGLVTNGGVNYYVYSLQGSAAGIAALHFMG